MKRKRIIIIGSGLTGLTINYLIKKNELLSKNFSQGGNFGFGITEHIDWASNTIPPPVFTVWISTSASKDQEDMFPKENVADLVSARTNVSPKKKPNNGLKSNTMVF